LRKKLKKQLDAWTGQRQHIICMSANELKQNIICCLRFRINLMNDLIIRNKQ